MLVVVGLGNPGTKYERHRHNVGFMLVDELASNLHAAWKLESRHKAFVAVSERNGHRVALVKPQTFMNLSGQSVLSLAAYYKTPVRQVLAIFDDIDLPFGEVRFREKGGHGGHNGVRSMIQSLGSSDFARIKVGVGRPSGPCDVADWVLSDFSKVERGVLESSLHREVEERLDLWMDQVQVS